MLDILPTTDPEARATPRRYRGPERRADHAEARHWLAATLDEIDYGTLLVTGDGRVIHVNHAARTELDAAHPLQLLGGQLRAHRPQDVAPLAEALHGAAARSLRKLLTLGDGANRVSISVVPLAANGASPVAPRFGDPHAGAVTLLLLGKRRVCESLSVEGFARSHGLTTAETRVLAALCAGTPPGRIAAEVGVAISTVRTQIGNIRQKTGAASIRALVQQVAVLPPLMGVLRGLVVAPGLLGAAPYPGWLQF